MSVKPKIALPPRIPLTNIGTSIPPRLPPTSTPPRFQPPGDGPTGRPVALPVAQLADETPEAKVVAPDPLWTSRWQPSKTKDPRKRPWVVAYRWWAAGVAFESWGPSSSPRIDLMWRDHRHAYIVSQELFERFRQNTGSVGEWFHKHILGKGWRPGMGSKWPNWAL